MAWDFHVGQRVQCVYDAWACPDVCRCPRKGDVLTIRDVFPGFEEFSDFVFLRFVEIRNPPVPTFGEPAFVTTAFRPLDETRLDQFRVHLAPRDPEPAVRAPEREIA